MSPLKKSKNAFFGLPVFCFILSALCFLYGLSFILFPVDIYIWDDVLPFCFYGSISLIVGFLVSFSRNKKAQEAESQSYIAELSSNKKDQSIFQPDPDKVSPVEEEKPKDVFKIFVPTSIGTETLVYSYNMVPIDLSPEADHLLDQIMDSDTFDLSFEVSEKGVSFSRSGTVFGFLSSGRLTQMIRDFSLKGDTVKSWFQEYTDKGCFVYLAFYQDLDKKYSYRESCTYQLTRYASSDIQDTICFASLGALLDVEEDGEEIWITDGFNRLGLLPKSAADKYLDEGAAAVLLESVEYDEDRDKHVPIVKIYW